MMSFVVLDVVVDGRYPSLARGGGCATLVMSCLCIYHYRRLVLAKKGDFTRKATPTTNMKRIAMVSVSQGTILCGPCDDDGLPFKLSKNLN